MTDNPIASRNHDVHPPACRWRQDVVLGTVWVVVISLLVWLAGEHQAEFSTPPAAAEHYNLLTEGLRAGQLSLKREVPAGLRQLADPYDPVANAPYRAPPENLHDASFFQGRLYLYFGIVPALVLFWPWLALTGQHLPERYAVAIFCALGFLAAAALLRAIWRRYFSEVSVLAAAACTLAIGLATGIPVMLERASFYEVPVSGAYALTTLALFALWKTLDAPARQTWWLAAASTAYGLALGSRPSVLFGAVLLLIPVVFPPTPAAGTPGRRRSLLAAAAIPIALIGLGLLAYNALRFGDPLEFGQRYQLAGDRQAQVQHFSLGYLWFNFHLYFLDPMPLTRTFPFVDNAALPPLPAGHVDVVEAPIAILTNVPLIWLSLAAPLAWRGRPSAARSVLRRFLTAVALLGVTSAMIICLFYTTSTRYEVEFLPTLLLPAAIGIFAVERALAVSPAWRRAARCGWVGLLVCSVALNLFASTGRFAEKCYGTGSLYFRAGRMPEAIAYFERSLRFKPGFARAHADLAIAFLQQGREAEAVAHLQQALRLNPNNASAHINLGTLFATNNRFPEAAMEYRNALLLDPKNQDVHVNLGNVLLQMDRVPEAIAEYREALRLNPNDSQTRLSLQQAELLQASPRP